MILTSYMPVDNNRYDDDFICYMEVMSEVEEMIHKLDLTHVLFGGDLNTDLIRLSPHAVALMIFINT